MKNIIHFLQYLCLRIFAFPLSLANDSILYGLAKILGLAAYRLGIRRRVTVENLQQALGEMSQKTIEQTARQSYINIAMTFLEIPGIYRLKKKFIEKVDLEGVELLNEVCQRGKGMTLISAHFGNWEITGATNSAVSSIPITTVATRQSNPYVDRYITRVRKGLGLKKIVPLAESAKALVAALRNKEAIGLISDQNAGPHGVFVNFFGKKASTPRGSAQLALKFKTPVVVTLSVRTTPGRHKCIFKEVEIRDDDTVTSLTQRYTKIMEDIIRQYPEQYFWMHRRWKTRPEASDQ
jgi:KDO2-lipid IV(A) lauroyltransferase